jgi:hypothetical protein
VGEIGDGIAGFGVNPRGTGERDSDGGIWGEASGRRAGTEEEESDGGICGDGRKSEGGLRIGEESGLKNEEGETGCAGGRMFVSLVLVPAPGVNSGQERGPLSVNSCS